MEGDMLILCIMCDIVFGIILWKRRGYDREVLGTVISYDFDHINNNSIYCIEYKANEATIKITQTAAKDFWQKVHKGSKIRIKYKSTNPYKYIVVNDPNIVAIKFGFIGSMIATVFFLCFPF